MSDEAMQRTHCAGRDTWAFGGRMDALVPPVIISCRSHSQEQP